MDVSQLLEGREQAHHRQVEDSLEMFREKPKRRRKTHNASVILPAIHFKFDERRENGGDGADDGMYTLYHIQECNDVFRRTEDCLDLVLGQLVGVI